MDTHIASAPDLDGAGVPLGSPIRLPGERGTLPHSGLQDEVPGDSREHDVRAAFTIPLAAERREKVAPGTDPRSRRKGLLATAAIVLVLAGTGGAMWAQRQGIVNLPLPAQVAAMLKAAQAPAGAQTVAEVGGPAVPKLPAAPVAAPAGARPGAPVSRPIPADAAEFAALKESGGPVEVGARNTGRSGAEPGDATSAFPAMPVSPVRGEADAAVLPLPLTPTLDVASTAAPAPAVAAPQAPAPVAPTPTPAPAPTAAAPAAIPAPASAPLPAPKLRDPIQTATELRAELLAPAQQVEAVGLVRELGVQLRDTRLTVAQLSATVAGLKQQLDAKTTEFDSRLTLAEAGTVLAESAKAGNAAPPAPVPQRLATRAGPAARPSAPPVSVAPASGAAARTSTVKDFRIQGASPGLAVLNVLNPAAGEPPVLYLAPGDLVPGLGRVKSIYQRGTNWVVQTDNGLIQ